MNGEPADQSPRIPRFSRMQWRLTITMLLCYAVGYPLALTITPVIGWTLVTIGGLLLLGLGAVTINRMHHEVEQTSTRTQG